MRARKPANIDPSMVRLGHASSIVISKLTPAASKRPCACTSNRSRNDPKLDFYTMYKQETTEYDTEHMRKHNEDLNTTLIFVSFCVPVIATVRSQAGLFSAVSSAFVIDVQSNLQPDSGQRSEAYLRALLLSPNQPTAPGEVPAAPPVWNAPPVEIITTSNLLYASLLMSLLAASLAMLGKQWPNKYLRHAGGSMIERCDDHQRKIDRLAKWPFRLFIESLPVMLQIALLLLSCGLSRYMQSVNVPVARVADLIYHSWYVTFYLGIVDRRNIFVRESVPNTCIDDSPRSSR
jgi:hypothetical protein